MTKKFNINAEIVLLQEITIKRYKDFYTPQANNLTKISTAIEVLKHAPINEKDLATGFSMNERQASYYSEAMRFLELINTFNYHGKNIISLTDEAYTFFSKTKNIDKMLAKWIIDKNLIEEYETNIKKRLNRNELGDVTSKRRIQSLEAWKKFIEKEK